MDMEDLKTNQEDRRALINEILREILETEEDLLIEADSELLRKLHKKVSKIRRKKREIGGKQVSIYIQKDNLKYLPILIDYYYDQGLIKSKTEYAFCSYIVNECIKSIVQALKEGNIPKHPRRYPA